MKKPENSLATRSGKLEQHLSISETEQSEGGVHWLRHSGVGPGRRPKISGEVVTSLGSLEAEVMGLVWEIGRPTHAMEVAEAALYKRRAQGLEPIAFSTISTTLRRLSEKGLLSVAKDPGGMGGRGARTPYYEPTVGREEMAARILDNVSRTLLGSSLHALIPKLTGGVKPGKEDGPEQERLNRLMQALEEAALAEDADSE